MCSSTSLSFPSSPLPPSPPPPPLYSLLFPPPFFSPPLPLLLPPCCFSYLIVHTGVLLDTLGPSSAWSALSEKMEQTLSQLRWHITTWGHDFSMLVWHVVYGTPFPCWSLSDKLLTQSNKVATTAMAVLLFILLHSLIHCDHYFSMHWSMLTIIMQICVFFFCLKVV